MHEKSVTTAASGENALSIMLEFFSLAIVNQHSTSNSVYSECKYYQNRNSKGTVICSVKWADSKQHTAASWVDVVLSQGVPVSPCTYILVQVFFVDFDCTFFLQPCNYSLLWWPHCGVLKAQMYSQPRMFLQPDSSCSRLKMLMKCTWKKLLHRLQCYKLKSISDASIITMVCVQFHTSHMNSLQLHLLTQ